MSEEPLSPPSAHDTAANTNAMMKTSNKHNIDLLLIVDVLIIHPAIQLFTVIATEAETPLHVAVSV